MSEKTEYMNLAWEIARDVINLSDEDRTKIFGYSDVGNIIKNNSPNTVSFKIFQYKTNIQEEKINIGDIVECDYFLLGIVVNIVCEIKGKEEYNILFMDGESEIYPKDKLQKTNRSIDILHILEEIILE